MADVLPEAGCFVYQVVTTNGVQVNNKGSRFSFGELISVDLVEQSLAFESAGSRLRLADGSGWVTGETGKGEKLCTRVHVEDGMWIFYAAGGEFQNAVPLLRCTRHPTQDRLDLMMEQSLWPFQKVYCDKRVKSKNGTKFYKVQGLDGWVPSQTANGDTMLHHEALVTEDLKAFRTLQDLNVRSAPTVDPLQDTGVKMSSGSLVVVDYTITLPNEHGNGPFLRLADDSGWLYVNHLNEAVVEEVPVVDGTWEFVVQDTPLGVARKVHPNDSDAYYLESKAQHFEVNDQIVCDKEVEDATNGVKFYRVKGTTEWVPNKHYEVNQILSHIDGAPSRGEGQLLLSPLEPSHIVDSGVSHHHNKNESTDTSVTEDVSIAEDGHGNHAMDADEEEALRSELSRLERNFFNQRNQILKRLVDADLKRNMEACGRIQDQETRMEQLKQAKAKAKIRNALLVADQMGKLERRSALHGERRTRGDRFECELYDENNVLSMNPSDVMIAIGDKASLAVVNESSIVRYSKTLPNELVSVLESGAPLATYIALGSRGRYFIRTSNGEEKWRVDNAILDDILSRETVEFIAFGGTNPVLGPYETSYVVKTRRCDTQGYFWHDIPQGLVDIIQTCRPLHNISLGPNGEYFVAFKDGTCSGGNWQRFKRRSLNEAVERLAEEGWHIRDIEFGDDSTYVIRYSDFAGPFC